MEQAAACNSPNGCCLPVLFFLKGLNEQPLAHNGNGGFCMKRQAQTPPPTDSSVLTKDTLLKTEKDCTNDLL